MQRNQPAEADPGEPAEGKHIPHTNTQRRSTVLILHEVAEVLVMMRVALEQSPLRPAIILEATNAYEALALLTAVRVDLVLLPAEMRHVGCVELVARIREKTKDRTACVLLVEDAQVGQLAATYSTGARAHLRLPVDPAEFMKVVEQIAGQKQHGDIINIPIGE